MADKAIGDHKLVKTHTADEAIETNRFVKLVTATGVQPHVVKAGAGEAACGVSYGAYASGELVDVVKQGQAFVTTSANIAAGAAVAADAGGMAITAASTNQVLGQAQTDANSGEMVLVLLSLGGIF